MIAFLPRLSYGLLLVLQLNPASVIKASVQGEKPSIIVAYNKCHFSPVIDLSMKNNFILRSIPGAICLLFFCATGVFSQTPIDAILMEKKEMCVGLTYTHDNWQEYWEGTLKRDNGNIGVLQRQTLTPMLAYGISTRINVLAALSWVRTHATAGQIAGVSGLQDWGLWIKAEALRFGNLTIQTALGITGPASNYLPDYVPLNLGLGSVEGSARAIVQYQTAKGLYARAQAGYHVRSHTTIERTYYYTTQGYYSNKVDMPNAFSYALVLGSWMLDNSLRVELSYDGLYTTGGHDIRRQDVGFPSNKMIFTRIGGFGRWYLPPSRKFGLLASGGYILNGRNVGQSIIWTGGVTYQFGI